MCVCVCVYFIKHCESVGLPMPPKLNTNSSHFKVRNRMIFLDQATKPSSPYSSLICEGVVPLGSTPVTQMRDSTQINAAGKRLMASEGKKEEPPKPVIFCFPTDPPTDGNTKFR